MTAFHTNGLITDRDAARKGFLGTAHRAYGDEQSNAPGQTPPPPGQMPHLPLSIMDKSALTAGVFDLGAFDRVGVGQMTGGISDRGM